MREVHQHKASEQQKKMRNRFRVITAMLSLVVCFATAYALMMPGVTMESSVATELIEATVPDETTSASESVSESAVSSVSEGTDPADPAVVTNPSPTSETNETIFSTDTTDTTDTTNSIDTTNVTETTASTDTTNSTDVTFATESSQDLVAVPLVPFIYEDDKLIVTAQPDEQFALPEGAVFFVKEITMETDAARYAEYVALVDENAEATEEVVMDPRDREILAYDIGFTVDGVEVEPISGGVTVTIAYKTPEITAESPENVTMFHVVETSEEVMLEPVAETSPVIAEDGTVESVSFEASSFSPFLVTNGYTMSTSLHYSIIDQPGETFTNTPYYNATSPFGVAGSFHLFASDTLTLNAHTNGNFAAKNVRAYTNFGTNSYGAELSYVQNYLNVTSTDGADMSDILVLGSSNTVSLVDNGNAFAVNGTKIDKPQTIWIDFDTTAMPFVDMASAKAKLDSVATMLSTQPNGNMTSSLTTSGDPTNSYLTLTNVDKIGVYNFTAAQLMSYANGFSVRGFTASKMGSVIININCAGQTVVNVPKIRMYIDGVNMPLSEMTTFTSGKILLNFTNSSGVTLNFNETYASVLAPNANVFSMQNLNGSIFAKNITINAESHRTDFTGSIPVFGSIRVTKTWNAIDNTPLTGTAIADMACSVQLYLNGSPMTGAAYTVTLTPTNSWTYQWTGLPLDNNQKYSVREVSISKGGVVIQTGDATNRYAVTYTNNAGIGDGQVGILNTVATGTVTVEKKWFANDGSVLSSSNTTSLAVSVQLYCNNVPMTGPPYTVTLNSANAFTWTWSELPLNTGQKYSVREAPYGGYSTTYENNDGISYGLITVKNFKGHPNVLPATGAVGTEGIQIAGTAMVFFSLLLAVYQKRRYGGSKRGERSG